jgi:hypothetical protein
VGGAGASTSRGRTTAVASSARSWSRREYDGERWRRRGGEGGGLLSEGDRQRGGGAIERARIGLRERERGGGGERLWVEDCLESVWGKKVGCKESLRAL